MLLCGARSQSIIQRPSTTHKEKSLEVEARVQTNEHASCCTLLSPNAKAHFQYSSASAERVVGREAFIVTASI